MIIENMFGPILSNMNLRFFKKKVYKFQALVECLFNLKIITMETDGRT